MNSIQFWLNDSRMSISNLPTTTTLLEFIRKNSLTGTKEGCAEGDCGACTVILLDKNIDGKKIYRAINSCLILMPMLNERRVYTVEALSKIEASSKEYSPNQSNINNNVISENKLHKVQDLVVSKHAGQCGYCTPGVVMSLFELYYRDDVSYEWQKDDQLCGNLCRCTGYRPIKDVADEVAGLAFKLENVADPFLSKIEHQLHDVKENISSSKDFSYFTEEQQYFQPCKLESLFDIMSENPRAVIICGGTDISLRVTKKFEKIKTIVSLDNIPELRYIKDEKDGLRIGSAVYLTDLHSKIISKYPPLDKILRVFASRQIKHRATIGGNLCNASPIGDLAPVLIALSATVCISSKKGKRELLLEDFFKDYRKTDLNESEILESIWIPPMSNKAFIGSYKISKRQELDISTVSLGCFVELDQNNIVEKACFAFGGMSFRPMRAKRFELSLIGKKWEERMLKSLLPFILEDFQPITDHRGSSWYRSTIAKNLIRAFFIETTSAKTQP